MRRTVVGVIAVATASSVFLLTGVGTASATSMLRSALAGTTVGCSPASEAATLQALHDALEEQWNAKDARSMRNGAHQAMTPAATTAVSRANQENAKLGQALAELATTHGKSASDLPLPGLGSLTALITSLLSTLLALITGLLGGLPVPLPPLPVGTPPAH